MKDITNRVMMMIIMKLDPLSLNPLEFSTFRQNFRVGEKMDRRVSSTFEAYGDNFIIYKCLNIENSRGFNDRRFSFDNHSSTML